MPRANLTAMVRMLLMGILALSNCYVALAQDLLVYGSYFGGPGRDLSSLTAADSSGNVFVTGSSASRGTPLESGPAGSGPVATFLAKFRPDGRLVWSKFLSVGPANAMAVDAAGEIVLAGQSGGGVVPVTPGVLQPDQTGRGLYIMRLNPEGELRWATHFGRLGGLTPTRIALSAEGRVAVCGYGSISDLPRVPGAVREQTSKSLGFCSILRADGSALEFSSPISPATSAYTAALHFEGEDTLAIAAFAKDWLWDARNPDPRRSFHRRDPADGHWETIGGARFGDVGAVATLAGRVYWAGDNGHFESGDRGLTWTRNEGFASSKLVLHPLNQLYRCSQGPQLDCSRDGGLSWTTIFDAAAGAGGYVTADPNQEGLFYYFSNNNNILKRLPLRPGTPISDPSYFQIRPFGQVTCLSAEAAAGSTILYVCASFRLNRSLDQGKTWEVVDSAGFVGRLLQAPGNPQILYAVHSNSTDNSQIFERSFDGGRTWADVGNVLSSIDPSLGPVSLMAIDPNDANRLVVATINQILMSADGARSWLPISEGLGNRRVISLAFGTDSQLYVGTESGNVAFAGKLNWRKFRWERLRTIPAAGGVTPLSMEADRQGGYWLAGQTDSPFLPFTGSSLLPNPQRRAQGFLAHFDADWEMTELRPLGEAPAQLGVDGDGHAILFFPQSYAGVQAPEGVAVHGRPKFARDGFAIGYKPEGTSRLYWLPGTLNGRWTGFGTLAERQMFLIGWGTDANFSVSAGAAQKEIAGQEDLFFAIYRLP